MGLLLLLFIGSSSDLGVLRMATPTLACGCIPSANFIIKSFTHDGCAKAFDPYENWHPQLGFLTCQSPQCGTNLAYWVEQKAGDEEMLVLYEESEFDVQPFQENNLKRKVMVRAKEKKAVHCPMWSIYIGLFEFPHFKSHFEWWTVHHGCLLS